MARTWRGPFFSPLNHERVDFFPSSLEAIDTTPQPKSGGIAQNKANLVSTFEKKTWSNTMYMWQIYEEIINICRSSWVVPLPSNSRHQDCYIFATLTGKGDNPIYVCKWHFRYFTISLFTPIHLSNTCVSKKLSIAKKKHIVPHTKPEKPITIVTNSYKFHFVRLELNYQATNLSSSFSRH